MALDSHSQLPSDGSLLAAEPTHEFAKHEPSNIGWRVVLAAKPSRDGAARAALTGALQRFAQAFKGFNGVGEPGEVLERKPLWLDIFGPGNRIALF